jgi:methylenetetrahydrofolate dehydrogenase (NADP+)/methenyltetrahydrofolate cyclohydrolase
MTILYGAPVAQSIYDQLLPRVQALSKRNVIPSISTLRIGERNEDVYYERSIIRNLDPLGIKVNCHILPQDSTQERLENEVKKIVSDRASHGCLLFRPFPPQFNETPVKNILTTKKDVDGITNGSLAGVYANTGIGFVPCTAQSCLEMLDYYDYDLTGKRAVVIGRSLVIGKPIAMLLLSRNATVTICHTRTKNLADICKDAEIIIAAAGHAKMLNAKHVSAGQIIIDVGINTDGDNKICGDVDYESVSPIVSAISPVPGGVGPVTNAVLAKHVVVSAEQALN